MDFIVRESSILLALYLKDVETKQMRTIYFDKLELFISMFHPRMRRRFEHKFNYKKILIVLS